MNCSHEPDRSRVPVVLIVFNRPELVAHQLNLLRPVRPQKLWVISDGPRKGVADDIAKIELVRSIVESEVDWNCDVARVYADYNLGCARRVSSGLDSVFAVDERAIILEDDCLPDPSFFRFCSELLEYYETRSEICQIGGVNFGRFRDPSGYYFSRYNHVWGWATWRRAWKAFDYEMADWPRVRETSWLCDFLGSRAAADYWRRAFDSVRAGMVESWAYRWVFAAWRRDWLTALPGVNLVENVGFDSRATNTKRRIEILSRSVESLQFPLVHPSSVRRDEEADEFSEERIYSGTDRNRLRRWLKQRLCSVLERTAG